MALANRKHEYDPEEDQLGHASRLRSADGGGEQDGNQSNSKANLRLVPSSGSDYDGAKSESSKNTPYLRAVPGIGKSDGKPRGKLKEASKADSSDKLADKEAAAESGAIGKVGSAEKSLLGKGFTGEESKEEAGGNILSRVKNKVKITKKKAAIGLATGAIAGGGLFGFSIMQGPLQMIHLSQILQKADHNTSKTALFRTKGLLRWYKTGNFGETRVGIVGSKIMKKTIDQLDAKGINFPVDGLGRQSKLRIDTSAPDSPWKDQSRREAQRNIALDLGLDESSASLRPTGGPGKFELDLDQTKLDEIDFTKVLTKTSLEHLGNGRIVTAVQLRVAKKFWGQPRLMSPLQKRIIAKETGLVNKADRKKMEEERAKPRIEANNQRSLSAREKLKGELDGKSAVIRSVAGGLVITEAYCLVRDVADDAVNYNYAAIVVPAMVEATDKMAVGAQIQSGQKFHIQEAGAVAESFTDESGKNIWGSKPLNALARGGAGHGEEIPVEYQQAFSNNTTADNVRKTVGEPQVFGIGVGRVACSLPGQLFQAGLSVALGALALGAAPFTLGGSFAAFVAKTGAGAAATAGVMFLLTQQLSKLLASESIVPIPPKGPLGGSLLAYGNRARANMNAMGMGGVALTTSEERVLLREQEQEDKQELQSKSTFARYFDVYDHRSIAAAAIDNTNLDFQDSANNLAAFLPSIPERLVASFSLLTPKAIAADPANEQPYNWLSPKYGIPEGIYKHSTHEDPYKNAEEAAQIFETNDDYIEKAKKCFGVEISKGADGWQTTPANDVNPAEAEYVKEKCDNASDPNWQKTMLFVFDDRLVAGMACYDGDEEICAEIGATASGGATGASASPTGTVGTTVDPEQLGRNSDNLSCAEGTKDLGVVTTLYTGTLKKESGPLKIRLCQITDMSGQGNDTKGTEINGGPTVDARVSGAWGALAKKAKADGVSLHSNSSFRLAHSCGGTGDGTLCARPGQSFHQTGLAIDMGGMQVVGPSTTDCSVRARADFSKEWKWLLNNAEGYGIKQYTKEAWHWDPSGLPNRCGKDDG